MELKQKMISPINVWNKSAHTVSQIHTLQSFKQAKFIKYFLPGCMTKNYTNH